MRVQLFQCAPCRITIGVLPEGTLPYRQVSAHSLEAEFDCRSKLKPCSGLDPPVGEIEKGCLQRAWKRFESRTDVLIELLGQIAESATSRAAELWRQLRSRLGSLQAILDFLARAFGTSLLADYKSLRHPASSPVSGA